MSEFSYTKVTVTFDLLRVGRPLPTARDVAEVMHPHLEAFRESLARNNAVISDPVIIVNPGALHV